MTLLHNKLLQMIMTFIWFLISLTHCCERAVYNCVIAHDGPVWLISRAVTLVCGVLQNMTEAELYSVHKSVYVPTHLHPPESLKYCEEFTFRPEDILIVTYPKSGE